MHKENEKENKKIKVEFVLDKSSGLYNSVIIKPENKEEILYRAKLTTLTGEDNEER